MALAPPRAKGPPLNALRAFEAAARHESFLAAAAELSVTPGAIAQQVKALEAWLGHEMFERRAQGVRLTAGGRSALPQLVAAFDALGAATQALRRTAEPAAVHIAALPAVAQLWLLPRLPALRAAFDQLTISVTALERPPNLVRDGFDLSLFFGAAKSHSRTAVQIATGDCFPVCAPKLARRLRRPEDLLEMTLLHDTTWQEQWPRWFEAAGMDGPPAVQGPVFSLYSLAVEEALQSAGVLMGVAPLVEAHLRSGRLRRPFDVAINANAALIAGIRPGAAAGSIEWQIVRHLTTRAGG